MEKKYKVTSYQLVKSDNQRDTVTLMKPIFVDDVEQFRDSLRRKNEGCRYVNLNYTTINLEED